MKVLIVVLIAIGLLILGIIIPRLTIDSGLENLTAEQKAVVSRAFNNPIEWAALGCLDNPIHRGVTQRIKVVSIDFNKNYKRGYVAKVKVYTLFNIPLQTISITDESTNCF